MQAVCVTRAECDCRSLGSQGTELSVLSRLESRKTQGVDRDVAALLDISRSFLAFLLHLGLLPHLPAHAQPRPDKTGTWITSASNQAQPFDHLCLLHGEYGNTDALFHVTSSGQSHHILSSDVHLGALGSVQFHPSVHRSPLLTLAREGARDLGAV